MAIVVAVVGVVAILFVVTHDVRATAQWQITVAFIVAVICPLVTAQLLMDAYEVGEL
ncbi:hypothetical protein BPY_23470 [Bifidobacterium psychraerophilum]